MRGVIISGGTLSKAMVIVCEGIDEVMKLEAASPTDSFDEAREERMFVELETVSELSARVELDVESANDVSDLMSEAGTTGDICSLSSSERAGITGPKEEMSSVFSFGVCVSVLGTTGPMKTNDP